MIRFSAAAIAAILSFASPAASDDARPGQRLFTTAGLPDLSFDGSDVFALNYGDQRFRLPPGSAADHEPYLQLLEEASERGFSVRVRYDGTLGQAVPGEAAIIYPLCSLSVGAVQPIGDEAENCPALPARSDAAARLGVAIAYSRENPQRARAMLGEVLATNTLDTPLRALTLSIRGDSAEAIAVDLEPASPEHDQLIAEALADYRNWVVVAPDLADAKLGVARTLAELGGYEEAAAVLEATGRVHPERAFDVAIRLGALHRQRGDYARALAQLDEYAARNGAPEGMRFHYHRAWTLMMLRRDSEAAAAINEGLRGQPDYTAAYRLRACVRARQGQIAEAVADQERAYELLMQIPGAGEAIMDGEVRRYRVFLETLRAAAAARPSGPIPTACDGFLDRWSQPRPRSALLPSG